MSRTSRARHPRRRVPALALLTWLYVLWSLLPVLVAVRISFNDGRSRSTFQPLSLRWYVGDSSASLLHDVGKLVAPDYVLNKPGALSPGEFRRIMQHASKGALCGYRERSSHRGWVCRTWRRTYERSTHLATPDAHGWNPVHRT